MQPTFGRIYKEDPRDLDYVIRDTQLPALPAIAKKNWWADGWHGDQGTSPECVVYSWSHWFEDGPVIQDTIPGRRKPVFTTRDFYDACQQRDQFPGTDYAGTTVRAGAEVLKELGVITEYRWALTVEDIAAVVTYMGPMVVGTTWYSNMSIPTSRQHIIHPTGKAGGGHAYLINGVDMEQELFRVKNSWGRHWGDNSHAYIRFADFRKLLHEDGEACVAVENKISIVPRLEDLNPA